MRPSGNRAHLIVLPEDAGRPTPANGTRVLVSLGVSVAPPLAWPVFGSSRERDDALVFLPTPQNGELERTTSTLLGTRFRYESRWRASGATTTICGRRSCERRRGPSKGGRSRVSEETAATSGGSSPARTAPARLQPNSRTPSARRTARATTGPWSARFRPTTTRGRCWGRATRRGRTTRPYLRRYPTTSCSRWRGTD